MSSFFRQKKFASFLKVTAAGMGAFCLINIYKGNERFYKNWLMPVMHILNPEKAHELSIFICKHRLIPKSRYVDPGILETNIFGKIVSNPIGLAAGYDKHADAVEGLRDMGFGFVEVGSVTPLPQPGNEKPRVFRLPEDNAVINRYGFNSVGHDKVLERMRDLRIRKNLNYTVGVNLGKNKTSDNPIFDYVQGVNKFGPHCDYLVINVSSPNTPGLRNLQTKVALKQLLEALVESRNKLPSKQQPYVFLKLAPDLSPEERKDIAQVLKLKSCKIDGLIIGNTTIERPNTLQNVENRNEVGGLSGKPLSDKSTEVIRAMYKLTDGMTIIGVGGVFTGKDAYEKIKAGARAVQIYTGLIYEGPPIVTKIKQELALLLVNDGFSSVEEAIGKDAK